MRPIWFLLTLSCLSGPEASVLSGDAHLHNPSGNKAYIMNMYTHLDYRRRGIASARFFDLLVKEALTRRVEHISLEATSMGRPLYTKFGFVPLRDEMILPEEFVNGGKL